MSEVRMFIHKDNFLVCPMHALATLIVVGKVGEKLFRSISEKNCSGHLNKELKRLTIEARAQKKVITPGLTSHSLRSGSATSCNEHKHVKDSDVTLRGGWSKRGFDNSLLYKFGTLKTDGAAGRVLSGWPCTDNGGICPRRSLIVISEDEMRLFDELTVSLFSTANIEIDLAEVLCCVLLMHYEEVSIKYPECILLERMTRAVDFDHSVFIKWSKALQGEFIRLNAQWISVQNLQDISLAEGFTKMVEGCSSLERRLVEVHTQLLIQEAKNAAMEAHLAEVKSHLLFQTGMLSEIMQAIRSGACHLGASSTETTAQANAVSPAPAITQSNMMSYNQQMMANFFNPATYQQGQSTTRNSSNTSVPKDFLPAEKNGNSKDNKKDQKRKTTAVAIFQRWYIEKLHLCIPVNEKEVDVMNRAAKVVAYMKALLPEPVIITARPTNPPDVRKWTQHITHLSEIAYEILLKKCTEQRDKEAACKLDEQAYTSDSEAEVNVQTKQVSKKTRKARSVQGGLAGVYKRLIKMPEDWFNFDNCKDECTCSRYRYDSFEDLRTRKRRADDDDE